MSEYSSNRRHFLRHLGLGAGVLATTPILSTQAEAQMAKHSSIRAKRVVMISLDGICVDGFKEAKTPNLDTLMKTGSFTLDARVVMPSVTLPNWTSHLTGSGPEQHGVFNNNWTLEKTQYPLPAQDPNGYYPSVFQVMKEKLPSCKTAFYYNWGPLVYPYNKKYLDEVEFLKDDAYIPNYEKALAFLKKNQNLPTVVFLYSVHTDHAGHKYKWMSPEYLKSIEEADEQIGVFLKEMSKAELYRDTHFMFLTDHGGIGNGHGGTSAAEMVVPWGISGPGIKKNFIIKEPCNTVNTAALILRLFGIEQPLAWTGEVPESIFA